MHSSTCGQRKGEGAKPSVQIKRGPMRANSANDLLDEDGLRPLARLQKGSWWIRDGNLGQHDPHRSALYDEDLISRRTPDDASAVAFLGKLGQCFESRERRTLGGVEQHIDAAVGTGQGHLCRPAR